MFWWDLLGVEGVADVGDPRRTIPNDIRLSPVFDEVKQFSVGSTGASKAEHIRRAVSASRKALALRGGMTALPLVEPPLSSRIDCNHRLPLLLQVKWASLS